MGNSDRRPYLTATTLTQALLDSCQDNLEFRNETVVEIETPTGTIFASDRHKYIDGQFYEALLKFPTITRTVGEWLSPELQFSSIALELSNVDGRFNIFLQGGASFDSWIGKGVVVKIGLAENSATYTTIFRGNVTDVGGVGRTVKSIKITARDRYDDVNIDFPTNVFLLADYPKIEDRYIGKIIPVIYGDWTVDVAPSPATIPAYPVNGKDPFVDFRPREVDITIASPAVLTALSHNLDANDPVQLTSSGALPMGFAIMTTYYVKTPTTDTFLLSLTPGGAAINTSGSQSGVQKFVAAPTAPKENIKFVISFNDLFAIDTSNVYVKRNDGFQQIPQGQITAVGAGNKSFELLQNSTSWFIGESGSPDVYLFQNTDTFFLRLLGKNLSGYDDNIISQAQDILETYGGLTGGDFDANWTTYRDKASPAESAISTFKSRDWINETKPVLTYVLSLLEQVRLEAFVDRDQMFKISSLHLDDFDPSPSFTVKNWDVARDTFQTQVDQRNVFNRAQGVFNFLPDQNQNGRATAIYRVSAAVTQQGKEISKRLVFPNLVDPTVVALQVQEVLRIAAAAPENVMVELTPRALLLDIGEFVFLDVKIGSSIFAAVPCLLREVGYGADGRIIIKMWSTQVLPFPGYTPGYAGTVGGSTATITQET